jgi:hypothetical protein
VSPKKPPGDASVLKRQRKQNAKKLDQSEADRQRMDLLQRADAMRRKAEKESETVKKSRSPRAKASPKKSKASPT